MFAKVTFVIKNA